MKYQKESIACPESYVTGNVASGFKAMCRRDNVECEYGGNLYLSSKKYYCLKYLDGEKDVL